MNNNFNISADKLETVLNYVKAGVKLLGLDADNIQVLNTKELVFVIIHDSADNKYKLVSKEEGVNANLVYKKDNKAFRKAHVLPLDYFPEYKAFRYSIAMQPITPGEKPMVKNEIVISKNGYQTGVIDLTDLKSSLNADGNARQQGSWYYIDPDYRHKVIMLYPEVPRNWNYEIDMGNLDIFSGLDQTLNSDALQNILASNNLLTDSGNVVAAQNQTTSENISPTETSGDLIDVLLGSGNNTQSPTGNSVITEAQTQTQTTPVNNSSIITGQTSITSQVQEVSSSIVQNDKSRVVKMGGWLLGLFLLGKIVFSSDEKQKGMNNPDKIKTIEI